MTHTKAIGEPMQLGHCIPVSHLIHSGLKVDPTNLFATERPCRPGGGPRRRIASGGGTLAVQCARWKERRWTIHSSAVILRGQPTKSHETINPVRADNTSAPTIEVVTSQPHAASADSLV